MFLLYPLIKGSHKKLHTENTNIQQKITFFSKLKYLIFGDFWLLFELFYSFFAPFEILIIGF